MTLKDGWLNRQFEKVSDDVRSWPVWMQREAGFLPGSQCVAVARATEPSAAQTSSDSSQNGAKPEGRKD